MQSYIRLFGYSVSFDWWIPSLHVWSHHCLATIHLLFFLVFVLALSPGCFISPSFPSIYVFSWCFMTCLGRSHWRLCIFYRCFSNSKQLMVFKTTWREKDEQNSALTLSSPSLGAPKATVVIFSEAPSLSLGLVLLCLRFPRIGYFTPGFWPSHKGILTHFGNPDSMSASAILLMAEGFITL